jgi:hypothetical protein
MGIYTVLARALPDSFKGVFDPTTSVNHEIVTIRFLYFSTSVMSTCGYGFWFCFVRYQVSTTTGLEILSVRNRFFLLLSICCSSSHSQHMVRKTPKAKAFVTDTKTKGTLICW